MNALRALGSLLGAALVGRLDLLRDHFHSTILTDRLGAVVNQLPSQADVASASTAIGAQVTALTAADIYRALGCLALALVPAGLLFNRIPAPAASAAAPSEPEASR